MDSFQMNGLVWKILFVSPNDIHLIDRTRTLRIATTDPNTYSIYLSNILSGDFLYKVLIHELAHCALVSFNLLDTIHLYTKPEYWIDTEEWICNFIAEYGMIIFSTAYEVLGLQAWKVIPYEYERMIAS